MRYLFVLILLVGFNYANAQEDTTATQKSKIKVGYHFYLNYNLYSWHQKPFTHFGEKASSGQVLNILPGIGLGFWFGDIDNWTVAVEGGVEYLPFALDIDGYKGLGTLAFPIMAKAHFPVAKQQSTWLSLHVGAGAQVLKTDLYAANAAYQTFANPFYVNVVGELGFHVQAVGYKKQHLRELEFFTRIGGGLGNSIMFSSGLRVSFWNSAK